MSIMVWRTWSIDVHATDHPRGYVLRGSFGSAWSPKRIKRAYCMHILSHPDDIPYPDCGCGIYGYKHDFLPFDLVNIPMSSIDMNSLRIHSTSRFFTLILGVAEIWGKTIQAEFGYRAEFAKMRALINAESIAHDYGVPNLPSVEYARREYFE
jgi:hypothetical protein